MEIDKTTYQDLSILNIEEEYSLMHRINFCKTDGGKEQLQYLLLHPCKTFEQIKEAQETTRKIVSVLDHWPQQITNGTIFVLLKFLGYPFNKIPNSLSPAPAFFYRAFEQHDYHFCKYSLPHFIDFLKGMKQLAGLLEEGHSSAALHRLCQQAKKLLNHTAINEIAALSKNSDLSPAKLLQLAHQLRYELKQETEQLVDLFHLLDAHYSLAKATQQYNLHFPELRDTEDPVIEAEGLYHLLLREPVAYNVTLNPQTNFLFLTGANMAGKSTFIKSVGCAVYMAHLGMGVPAAKMKLSVFDGLLSNIHVADNIVKGESYFFNEVQRIKNTILKISDKRKWLVLIDELFKGTNIQDAMYCSSTVIKGLLKMKHSLFILSTHLYEIGDELKSYPNITFRYFETSSSNEQLHFSYQLKEGISNDRFGYLILKREKVVDLLNDL